jgi:putative SOS response-associated peptidase YedK
LPGRVFLTASFADLAGLFAAEISRSPGAAPPGELAAGDMVPAVIAGRRLVMMRWGLIPMGRRNARGRPVLETIVNARSETLFAKSAFADLRRCLMPAGGWYEWTGERRRKTRWAIRWPGRGVIALAGVWDLWRGPGGAEVASFAVVTCAPSEEVAAVHDRMPVIVAQEDWAVWLGEAAGDVAALMRPPPDGVLQVEIG